MNSQASIDQYLESFSDIQSRQKRPETSRFTENTNRQSKVTTFARNETSINDEENDENEGKHSCALSDLMVNMILKVPFICKLLTRMLSRSLPHLLGSFLSGRMTF